MFATIEYHSMTAKTTANSVHTGRQMRTIVESDGARRNSSGPPRTSVDGRRAVFKTVCGLCKSEPTRASSYMWLLIMWLRHQGAFDNLLLSAAPRRRASLYVSGSGGELEICR